MLFLLCFHKFALLKEIKLFWKQRPQVIVYNVFDFGHKKKPESDTLSGGRILQYRCKGSQ